LHVTCYYSEAITSWSICGGANTATPELGTGGSEVIRGIIIPEITLTTKHNPLYPNEDEIDFIVCFRYTSTAANLARTEDTNLASVGVLNTILIDFKEVTDCTTTTEIAAATNFRIGYLNYYAAPTS
jgi:hypothetical protein